MNGYLLVATRTGLVVCQPGESDWQPLRTGLPEEHITSVIARQGVILAGSLHGVFRSDDLGCTWIASSQGLDISYVRWLAFNPQQSDFELAGTEPAGIFISRDGARSWRSCPEVTQLRQEFNWFLPYSPRAGCVRGFAYHGPRAYAAVEVGGVLLSEDSGQTWQLAPGSSGQPRQPPVAGQIHPDVHSIAVHPSSPDLVFAPTGGGFFASRDAGRHWEQLYPGSYCRAVWLDPQDPDHLLLGVAQGVDRHGRIERSLDGGRTWKLASAGLEVPWRTHMVERFFQVEAELLAVLSNGELLSADIQETVWRRILPDLAGVNMVAWLPEA